MTSTLRDVTAHADARVIEAAHVVVELRTQANER